MAKFLLPANSRVQRGQTYSAPAGSVNVKRFSVYRYDPESGQPPPAGYLRSRYWSLRAHGARRALQNKKRDRRDAHVQPFLPRRNLRVLRDEYQREKRPSVNHTLE